MDYYFQVSTLTGSSEVEVATPLGRESLGSLASMSLSAASNCSSSSPGSRRHSVNSKFINILVYTVHSTISDKWLRKTKRKMEKGSYNYLHKLAISVYRISNSKIPTIENWTIFPVFCQELFFIFFASTTRFLVVELYLEISINIKVLHNYFQHFKVVDLTSLLVCQAVSSRRGKLLRDVPPGWTVNNPPHHQKSRKVIICFWKKNVMKLY